MQPKAVGALQGLAVRSTSGVLSAAPFSHNSNFEWLLGSGLIAHTHNKFMLYVTFVFTIVHQQVCPSDILDDVKSELTARIETTQGSLPDLERQ